MMGAIIRLKVSKAAADKVLGTVDGNQLRVGWMCSATFEKNKLAVPGKTAGYTFVFKECPEHPFGIDNARSVADLAIVTGVARVEKVSIYYPLPDGTEAKVVGRNKFLEAVKNDPNLTEHLAKLIAKDMSKNAVDKDAEDLID